MRRHCEFCERPIHLVVFSRRERYGVERPEDHTVCHRCWRRLRDQLHAERTGPKPWYAVRSTLRVWEQ